ncbi:MAG: hypothetical protein QGI93_05950 [Planctomycetota bacterium]|jgi:hypothetical protein|nr:hypothetical protein [Candidatus Woesearchaeota archaeon]MDP6385721.1 hypothetical protein [Planctomycetota bacterium]MDP6938463.1 hypothetical protein [Planctomycetota bacterium]
MGKFETDEDHPGRWHRPVCVPIGKEDVFGSALEMLEDLSRWSVRSVDKDGLSATYERNNGPLRGTSTIVVRVEGPDGLPNSQTHCSSQSDGALLSRDKANVAEFIQKFWMRVT